MIEARKREDLAAAGADLAAAVQRIGPDRFARYLSDASRRSLRAVGDDEVPGVKLASIAGSDTALGLVVLFGIGIWGGIHSFHSRPRPAPFASPTETPKPLPPTVVPAKPPSDAKDTEGAKAPGKPGEEEGFEDPKGGEQWVASPNGRGYGWLDAKGDVWVPTGPGDDTHGGPHWDVQSKNGYRNAYPGGMIRKGR
jgi:hypothetical protein